MQEKDKLSSCSSSSSFTCSSNAAQQRAAAKTREEFKGEEKERTEAKDESGCFWTPVEGNEFFEKHFQLHTSD